MVRPLMDAGYTAWRDGQRLGIVRLVDGFVEVEAVDDRVARLLSDRLEADLRLVRSGIEPSNVCQRQPTGVFTSTAVAG